MPVEFQAINLPLSGLDQKTASLLRGPGTFERVINGEYAKGGGRINKRRGYQRLDPTNIVGQVGSADTVFTHVAKLRDELVVFSHDHVYGVGDRASMLRGDDALVYRGPCNRGSGRMVFVSQSRISEDYDDGGEVSP
jgi:hypothetical protein